MTYANKSIVNYSGGEASPKIHARTDIPIFNKVIQRAENFVVEPQGTARYRNGTMHVHRTRFNNFGVYIPFQFRDDQAYLIEATAGYFRFFKESGIILEAAQTITGITQANPGVLTITSHGYETDDEIYISGVGGMEELNGKFYFVTRIDANTFSLKTVTGTAIDTSTYTAFTSGGTAEKIYEIRTPYEEEYLRLLKHTQNADTMYIVARRYMPRKLTRSTDSSWALSLFSRTADPFVAAVNISGITQANPAVVTAVSHGLEDGELVYIEDVVGMTEVNYTIFTVANKTANTFELSGVDSSAYTAYSSGGTTEQIDGDKYPAAVTFTDDARLKYGGTKEKPETMWDSRSPAASGAVRFDDFTTGTDADHAVIFTLAPVHGKVDDIRWLANTDKFVVAGTYGSVRRIYGATEQEPISPDSITAKPVNTYGVANTIPVSLGSSLFFIQRGSKLLRSFEYDYVIDGYISTNRNLVSDHLNKSSLIAPVNQQGGNEYVWIYRADGKLLGLTYSEKEQISGWHRHSSGGSGVVEATGIMSRDSGEDVLWMIVKRTINGNVVRHHEYIVDEPVWPDLDDFYTDENSKETDEINYLNVLFERQKHGMHLDASSVFDGSAVGAAANATLTVGTGGDVVDTEDVVFTASAAVFTSDMVGRELWGKHDDTGAGGGRMTITSFTSTTQVEGTITSPFPASNVFAAGSWYLTATQITGLDYLEGSTVRAMTDGGIEETDKVVTDGAITLDAASSVVYVGLPYTGILKTIPIDQGGVSGPAQSKTKGIADLAFRVLNSAEFKFGEDLYNLESMVVRESDDFGDRPTPLYNGYLRQNYLGTWDADKSVVVVQDRSKPLTVAAVDIYADTVDE